MDNRLEVRKSKWARLLGSRSFWIALSPLVVRVLSDLFDLGVSEEMVQSIMVSAGGVLVYLLWRDKIDAEEVGSRSAVRYTRSN